MPRGLGLLVGLVVCWVGTVAPAAAATIFAQDFESGLGPNEQILANSPGFGRTDAATLGNGSFGIGHTQGYILSNGIFAAVVLDAYTVTLDFSRVRSGLLAFDYRIDTERFFDPFFVTVNNVVRPVVSGFAPNNAVRIDGIDSDVLTTLSSDRHIAGAASGRAVFNLLALDAAPVVTIRIGLAVDSSNRDTGIFIDNIAVTGTQVPLPGALPLLLTGLAAFGLLARRRVG